MGEEKTNYREINQRGWEYLARHGCDSCQPYGRDEIVRARDWLDMKRWIDWNNANRVLCLAGGGGQQALLLASLGCTVTSLDLSSDQLATDRDTAKRYGLAIETIEGDMLDLSGVYGRDFDLVYQAVSACYIPNVRRLYQEVARVLRPGGLYRVEHWNPVHLQLADTRTADQSGYRIIRPQKAGDPLPWAVNGHAELGGRPTCVHYIHPLNDLMGGLGDAGLDIIRFAECRPGDISAKPGSHAHLAAYLPPFFTILARLTKTVTAHSAPVPIIQAAAVPPSPPALSTSRETMAGVASSVSRSGARSGVKRQKSGSWPRVTYLICTQQRSGSWLLSESLEKLGIAGRPREFFLEAFEKEWFAKWNVSSYAEYLPKIVAMGTTKNGVFGLKFHWYQFDELARKLQQIPGHAARPLAEILTSLFPNLRYVWLHRQDKVRQAVSHYKATLTGQWWKINGVPPGLAPGSPSSKELRFDFSAIERLEKKAIQHDEKWQRYFTAAGIEPLVIVYEDLARHYVKTIKQMLKWLGVKVPRALRVTARLRKQADELSEEWVQKYRNMQRVAATEQLRPADHAIHAILRPQHSGTISSSQAEANRTPTSVEHPAVNQSEIRIAALQRSGQHGIINWLMAQCPGRILFLNDVQPETNPYVTCTSATPRRVSSPGTLAKPNLPIFVEKDMLIYNYEDRSLDQVFNERFEQDHDAFVGRSARRFDVVILRDAFNTFASRMSATWVRHKLSDLVGRKESIRLWKSYAQEMLNHTHLARCNKLCINYNQWCCDAQYREEIAARLGLPFTDEGFAQVDSRYGGSSFDGASFNGRAHKMYVLERWKKCVDSDLFREIFSDGELVELSERIFGHIAGTEILIRNKGKGSPRSRFETSASSTCADSAARKATAPACDVVIVSHNEGVYLRRTIDSLRPGLPPGGKIVVVDDASTDGSADELQDEAAVVVVRPGERLGVSRSRNLGASYTGGHTVVFCDAHIEAPRSWASPLLGVLEDPAVGAVGAVISNLKNRTSKGYGLGFCGPALKWKYLPLQGREPYPVPLLGGAFFAMRREVFDYVGGFDEGMVLYGIEDAEMSLRLWLVGYQCRLVPALDVAHLFRAQPPQYQKDWETVLHNQLRLAVVHLSDDRIRKLIGCRSDNEVFPAALSRLIASDVWQRRTQLRATRRYDDDWFFRKFGME
jgi:LPS sulfotransferase NodH/GT2 family glycosyltransferase/SAM-dependent methyltransferase